MKRPPLAIVVLISGYGGNLQAMIDAIAQGLAIEIRAVISNRQDAYGLERAKQAGIPRHAIIKNDFPSSRDFEEALKKTIDYYEPMIIVLAGFMRKLSPKFVFSYRGKIINIHPSLLPNYPGLHTHERVLAAGDQEHGVSIHYVTAEVDKGPLICQASLHVEPEDTLETLTHRIHSIEHILYPQTLSWFAAGRLSLKGDQVFFDHKPLPPSGKQVKIDA